MSVYAVRDQANTVLSKATVIYQRHEQQGTRGCEEADTIPRYHYSLRRFCFPRNPSVMMCRANWRTH